MNLLFLDTETGGLEPWKHSLLQIGLVAYKNGVKDILKINLRLPEYVVTAEAMKYNGISLPEIYDSGLDPRRACHAITNFIRNNFAEKPILAGFNLSLDKYMLSRLLKEYYVDLDLDDLVGHRHLDLMGVLWMLHFAGKIPFEACSSSGAFKHFGIDYTPHDALSDALATAKLYEHLRTLI